MSKIKKRPGGHAGAPLVKLTHASQPASFIRAKPVFKIRSSDEICPDCAAWFLRGTGWKVLIEDEGSGPAGFANHLLYPLFIGAEEIIVGYGSRLPRTNFEGRVLFIKTENASPWRKILAPFFDAKIELPRGRA